MGELFTSEVRLAGDMAGVFEFDGDTSYFYLYDIDSPINNKVRGAIKIASAPLSFDENDISIKWSSNEQVVGLFIGGLLWAAFDCESRCSFGGDYSKDVGPNVPSHMIDMFSTN